MLISTAAKMLQELPPSKPARDSGSRPSHGGRIPWPSGQATEEGVAQGRRTAGALLRAAYSGPHPGRASVDTPQTYSDASRLKLDRAVPSCTSRPERQSQCRSHCPKWTRGSEVPSACPTAGAAATTHEPFAGRDHHLTS